MSGPLRGGFFLTHTVCQTYYQHSLHRQTLLLVGSHAASPPFGTVFPHLYAPLTVSLVLGFSSRLPRLQDIIMTWSTHHKTDRRKRDIVLNSDWVCRWIIPSVCWAAGWASSAAERLAPHTATPADTHRSPPDMGRSVPHTRQVTRLYQVWKVKVWVLDIALFPWEDSCKQRFSLGSGSWLGWASGTAAHYGFSAN